jgi:hypothetical protein
MIASYNTKATKAPTQGLLTRYQVIYGLCRCCCQAI